MTILQGTMQDGTVIPVQVDSQGRLVAEGLQGAPGPAGPAGPAGADGLGVALPTGQKRGDFLMWNGTELTWCPVFAGLWRSDRIVSVSAFTGITYSSQLGTNFNTSYPKTRAFDGLDNTYAQVNMPTQQISFSISASWNLSGPLEVNLGPNPANVQVNGATAQAVGSNTWTQIAPEAAAVTTVLIGNGSYSSLAGVRVNGVRLVDEGQVAVLTLASAAGLAELQFSEQVQQSTSANAGKVYTTDLAAKTVRLYAVQGAFQAGPDKIWLTKP